MEKRKLIPINITMDDEIVREIARLCEEIDTDRSKFIRKAVRFYLNELEKNPNVEKPEPALRLG